MDAAQEGQSSVVSGGRQLFHAGKKKVIQNAEGSGQSVFQRAEQTAHVQPTSNFPFISHSPCSCWLTISVQL